MTNANIFHYILLFTLKKTFFSTNTLKCQTFNIPLPLNQKIMEKNKTKTAKRSPLLIPVNELAVAAHQIFTLKPSEEIILNRLKEIYSSGVDVGYQRRISDIRVFNQKREARVKKSFDSLITHIEDTVHGGTTNKV